MEAARIAELRILPSQMFLFVDISYVSLLVSHATHPHAV